MPIFVPTAIGTLDKHGPEREKENLWGIGERICGGMYSYVCMVVLTGKSPQVENPRLWYYIVNPYVV